MSSLPDVTLGGTPQPAPHTPAPATDPTLQATPAAGEREATSNPEQVTLVHLPDSDLKGDRVTLWERGQVMARHWASQVSTGMPSDGVFQIRPESLAEYRAYVRTRAWLPDGYDGRVLAWVTVTYYNTLGTAGIAVGYGIAWVFGRMLRFNIAVAVAAVSVTLWLTLK